MRTWRVGSIEIFPDTRRVLLNGQPIPIGSRAFDLLFFLVQHRDRVVPKAELFRAVWPGMVVEDNNLTVQISVLRKLFGTQAIRTIASRGYRFVAEVEAIAFEDGKDAIALSDRPMGPPIPSTRFFGRDQDVLDISLLLSQCRLITLIGLAGAGKTRLAIELGRHMSHGFADGVLFLELAALEPDSTIEPALASALHIAQKVGKTLMQTIREALGQRPMLLILDNCEHVLPTAAKLTRELLSSCAGLRVLATSREPLLVEGEQNWPVTSLSVEAGLDSPAVQLFMDRARGVAPHLSWDGQADVLVDICQQLDGLPLAIELASVRMRSMTASQIKDHLTTRYQLLTVGVRGGVDRHQTLDKAVHWSYDLLSDAERSVLLQVCVFAGGFYLEAVQAIVGGGQEPPLGVLDLLDSLVRKSLLTTDHSGLRVRYGMLETIRQFTHAQLLEKGQLVSAQDAHAHYFLAQAKRQFALWRSAEEPAAYRWLDEEASNVQLAYKWFKSQDQMDSAIALVAYIYEIARSSAHEFAAGWVQEVLDEAKQRKHRYLPVVLCWASNSAWAGFRFDAVQGYAQDSLALLDQPGFAPMAWSYIQLAYLNFYQGNFDQALALAKTASEHPSDVHDRYCLGNYVALAGMSGSSDEALALATRALDLLSIDSMPCAHALMYMGRGAALEKTDPAACIADIERGASLARAVGNSLIESFIVLWLAATQARSGTPLLALQAFSRALQSYAQGRNLSLLAAWKAALIVVFERLGCTDAAAVVYGGMVPDAIFATLIPDLHGAVARLRKTLGADGFKLAQARGAAMPLSEALAFAQTHIQQAITQLEEGGASAV
jgi:predicted ATPase/DNA-binding winged helix-turn-helix (wHTH) protein